jgi:anti-sigma B factor antagonist
VTDVRRIPDHPSFEIRAEPEAGASRVVVSGELDVASAPEFEETLRRELAAGPVRLDLGGLTFMDSSGVRALDAVARDDGELSILPDLRDNVRQILDITGMIDVLPFAGGRRP